VTRQLSPVVDVQVACDDAGIPSATEIRAWVARAVGGSGKSFANGTELSVRVVNKEEIRSLNRDYRQKDVATNVLSFPGEAVHGLPDEADRVLGDVVVCASVVNDEAAEQGKPTEHHWAHMLVHGTLHLLGYDHETDAEAAEMEGIEVRILGDNGINDPYAESR